MVFITTSISQKKMKISKNKTYHKKVQDLSSTTIPHFQLNLKNSKSWPFQKKFQKVRRFFCPQLYISAIPCVWVENLISFASWHFKLFHDVFCFLIFSFFVELLMFIKTVLYFPIKSTTLRFFKFQKKKFFENFNKN